MDLFTEKLVLKFGRNRSRNNEVITILNNLWKKQQMLFLAPEHQIFGFLGFSKTGLVVHDERNRMAFTPSKSALRFSRSQGGTESSPPHQLTSSRKPTSNRVNDVYKCQKMVLCYVTSSHPKIITAITEAEVEKGLKFGI